MAPQYAKFKVSYAIDDIGYKIPCATFTVSNKVAKVMFLQVCVCPQGGCLTRYTPISIPLILGTTPWDSIHPPVEFPPEQPPTHQAHSPGTSTPPYQVHPPSVPGRLPRQDIPCMRYPRDQVHPPNIWPLLRMVRILLECILLCLKDAQ